MSLHVITKADLRKRETGKCIWLTLSTILHVAPARGEQKKGSTARKTAGEVMEVHKLNTIGKKEKITKQTLLLVCRRQNERGREGRKKSEEITS